MAQWKGTKTNWTPDDGVSNKNLNRLEENIQYNYDEINNSAYKQIGDIFFHGNNSAKTMSTDSKGYGWTGYTNWVKLKETRVAAGGNFRVRYSTSMEYTYEENKFFSRIYVNSSPKGTQRLVNGRNRGGVFLEDIYGLEVGDRIQVYGRIYIGNSHSSPVTAGASNLRLYCANFDGAEIVL